MPSELQRLVAERAARAAVLMPILQAAKAAGRLRATAEETAAVAEIKHLDQRITLLKFLQQQPSKAKTGAGK